MVAISGFFTMRYTGSDDEQSRRTNEVSDNPLQPSGTTTLNLSYYAIDEMMAFPISLTRGMMYNITFSSTGNASFDAVLANQIAVHDYVSQQTTFEYDDELLLLSAVPLWGSYNTWNGVSFDEYPRVTRGISLGSGATRSIMVFVAQNYPLQTVNCAILVELTATSNPGNNLLDVTWNTIAMNAPAMTVNQSRTSSSSSGLFNASSVSLINFQSQDGLELTTSILNQTVSANGSLYLVSWQKDVSGTFIRRTSTVASGSSSEVLVPWFKNLRIDGAVQPSFVINENDGSSVQLNWSFTEVVEPTISYAQMALANATINFDLYGENIAYRVVDLGDPAYFDIKFADVLGSPLINWNIGIDFHIIGKDGTVNIYNLDLMPENETESATIFAASQNDAYKNTLMGYSLASNDNQLFWIAGDGDPTPGPNTYAGSNRVGMVIRATPTGAYLNYTCSIQVTPHAIQNQTDAERCYVGVENGMPFGEFKPFQVRRFEFTNFSQYKWTIISQNTSSTVVDSNLVCNDIDNYARYPLGMNNSITSIPINASKLTGSIFLEFEVSTDFQNGDYLHVYVKNETGTYFLETFDWDTPLQMMSYNITNHTGTNLQIIFNQTSNNNGQGLNGSLIDNVRVWNTTDTAFLEDFEGDLSKWNETDNTGGTDYYWYIQRDDSSFSAPRVSVVYPNEDYTMVGYLADPERFGGFTYTAYGSNPFVQEGTSGYLVITTDEQIRQNISVTVSCTAYNPINIMNGTLFAANHTYPTLVSQSGYYWEEIVEMNEFYEYLNIMIEPEYRYRITLWVNGLDAKYTDVNVLTSQGTSLNNNITSFYGFFLFNHSYDVNINMTGNIFLKFSPVGAGAEITILFEVLPLVPQATIPLDYFTIVLVIAMVGVGLSAFFGALLANNRKVILYPKRR